MSHKQSITVTVDGKVHNVNTVGAGRRKMSNEEAVQRAIKTNTLGKEFGSVDEAVEFAKKKSKVLGEKFPHKNRAAFED